MEEIPKKVYIRTYGCQMNVYDSDKMADVMAHSHAMQRTYNIKEADLLLLNTCSVREKAQEKVFSELGQWRKLKKKPIIGVGGCVASQEGEAIKARAPFVNIIFGPQTLHRLPALYNQALQQQKTVIDISFPEIEKFDYLPEPKAESVTAFVSIMEGCSKFCSFCIVPYTRGEEISRPFDDVITEVVTLSEQGVREVNLLGQNVNDYRGVMNNGKYADLALLIHYIAAIDAIKRIRFTTSHPLAFSESLIQAYAEEPKLANHLHLPIQSGSDHILAAMKRGYTAMEYKSKIRQLRAVRPDISLSSDFIIGFPNESQADFQATMDIIKSLNFDHSFSFIYSKRPGTPAASLLDSVTETEKKQRLAKLQKLINLQAQAISQNMIHTKQNVLITGNAKKQANWLCGRTENNRVINFEGSADLIGQMVSVHVTEALPNSLRGHLLEEAAPTE